MSDPRRDHQGKARDGIDSSLPTSREGRGTPPRRGLYRRFFTLAVTLLAVWFLVKTLGDVGLAELNARVLGADPGLIALLVVLTGLRFVAIAARWEVLSRREAPVGLRRILPILMAGHFLSLVTPVFRIAGPILRAFYLSRETGKPRARFYGTIVADQTANFAVFAVGLSVSGVLVTLPEHFRISPAVGTGMIAVLCGGLFIGYRMLREVHRGGDPRISTALAKILGGTERGGWRERMVLWWDHLVRALSSSIVGSGAWWPSIVYSSLAFAMLVAVQMLAFEAVGTRVGIMEGTFAVAGAGFIQIMSAAPGGPGLTEASLIAVALALGIDKESAVAGVLIARFANYAVLIPWGGASFLRLQKKHGMPRSRSGGTNAAVI